jgi:hypothetical protein
VYRIGGFRRNRRHRLRATRRAPVVSRHEPAVSATPYLRRPTCDADFDVFLWLTPLGEITRQVCHSIGPDERALAWHQHAGLFHDGASGGVIASPTPAFDLARFEEAALGLPRTVRYIVKRHIREYVEGRLPAPARRRRFRREIWQYMPAARSA